MAVIAAGSAPSKAINQSAVDKARTVDFSEVSKASFDQKLDLERVLDIQSPCKSDNSDMKGIQRVIKNLQNDLEKIKRFSNVNSAFDALTNEDVEPWKSIKKVINFSATDIAGYVKNIMGRVRGWVMNTIQNQVKKLLPFLFPGEMPSFLDKLGKGLNGLSCAFAKIIRGLAKTVGNLLLQMLDKFINGPMCLIENFVNNLLKKILGPIEAAIKSVLDIIGGVLSAIGNLTSSLFNALDFITGILNFFKCDDDKACPSVQEITLGGAGSGGSTGTGGDPAGSITGPSSPSDGAKTTVDNATSSGVGNAKSDSEVNARISNPANEKQIAELYRQPPNADGDIFVVGRYQ